MMWNDSTYTHDDYLGDMHFDMHEAGQCPPDECPWCADEAAEAEKERLIAEEEAREDEVVTSDMLYRLAGAIAARPHGSVEPFAQTIRTVTQNVTFIADLFGFSERNDGSYSAVGYLEDYVASSIDGPTVIDIVRKLREAALEAVTDEANQWLDEFVADADPMDATAISPPQRPVMGRPQCDSCDNYVGHVHGAMTSGGEGAFCDTCLGFAEGMCYEVEGVEE